KVIDVQALAGDSTDNVPGVPGIGVKTAAELITNYGDLESLLAAAGSIKQPKRREKLIEFANQARISRELVTLKDDVPVEVPVDRLGVQDPRPEALLGFLRKMEFTTLTKRISDKLGVEAPAGAPPAAPANGEPAKDAAPTSRRGTGPAVPSGDGEIAPTHGPGTPAAGAAIHSANIAKVPFDRTAY